MGSALEAVLRLKEQEQQAQQFKSQQLTDAVNIFQRAREQAQQNQLQQLQFAQQQKYQDATINNQNIDNARQQQALDLQKSQFEIQKPLLQSQTDENIANTIIKKSNAESFAKNQALLYDKYRQEQSTSTISSAINNIMQPKQQSVSQNLATIGLPGMGGSALGVGQPPAPQQAPSEPASPIEGLTMPPKFKTVENDNGVLKEVKLTDDQQKYNTVYDTWQKNGKLGKGDIAWLSKKFGQSDLAEQRNERLLNQQTFSNSTKLRQEFINRPEVKDYMLVSPNIKAMDSLLKNGLNGNVTDMVALDQGLITMFNKLTDPQSVVRESEYARTPENLPLINRFKGAIQKISSGGAGLTNEDRQALVQGAKIIANERGKQFQKTKDEYKGTAADYGLDEKLITRDMPDFKEFSIGKNNVRESSSNWTPEKEARLQELRAKVGKK